jgi:glycosyltransferase involved in cell wall biosynthesis
MKLLYIANIRLPTEKAHGVQVMKMCEAFAKQDAFAALLVPKRHTPITESPFAYYGLKTEFPIEFLKTIDAVNWGMPGFLLQSYTFAKSAIKALSTYSTSVLYGRDEIVLWLIARSKQGVSRQIVWESHTGSWNFFARKVAERASHIVVISQGLKDFYVKHGVPTEKIIVAHDGIDLAAFKDPESKEAARTRLSIPADKKIALYIGRVDGWKGVDVLCKASVYVSPTIQITVIGGEAKQVEELSKKYPKVLFLGYRPYRELANNQAAADLLVLPNTGTSDVSAKFTSPLKLFSYMASNRPIVAAGLPSIREVIDSSCAYFATPDDPASFAKVIEQALTDTDAADKAETAALRVQQYTWEQRAQSIVSSIST